MPSNPDFWDANAAKLRALYADGMTISKIATALGVSRGAVAGAAHRLGLLHPFAGLHKGARSRPKREKREKRPRIAAKRNLAPRRFVAPKKRWVASESGPEPVPQAASLVELERGGCRWPHGTSPYWFCGVPASGGVYCEHHAFRAGKESEELR